jgi:hypothetical protein
VGIGVRGEMTDWLEEAPMEGVEENDRPAKAKYPVVSSVSDVSVKHSAVTSSIQKTRKV